MTLAPDARRRVQAAITAISVYAATSCTPAEPPEPQAELGPAQHVVHEPIDPTHADWEALARHAAQTTTTRPPRAARGSRQAPPPRARPDGDVWHALAMCESGADPRAVSASGRYRGAFQFSLATWRSVGMSGDPIDHPYAVQLDAAQRLQARSGWGQWPACSRRLGLR